MIEPAGKFELYQFDGSDKYVVRMKGKSAIHYYCGEVKPYALALVFFWRYIGAA